MTQSVYTSAYNTLRRLLIDARKARGLTQIQVADALRKPQSFVSKYEHGERRLDVVEFVQIAHVLRLDVHDVLGELNIGVKPRGQKHQHS